MHFYFLILWDKKLPQNSTYSIISLYAAWVCFQHHNAKAIVPGPPYNEAMANGDPNK